MTLNFADELAEITQKAVAKKNRVEILLDTLTNTDPQNYANIVDALEDLTISNAAITRTIKKIWGAEAVKDSSVREYRIKNGLV